MVPCDGLGTLLQCVAGAWCVVMWPSTAITHRGASLSGGYAWLNKDLNAQTFKQWADDNTKYCQLVTDAAVWVPYGWHYCAMATYGKGVVNGCRLPSFLLMQPYLSVSLANETWPIAEDASKAMCDYLQHVQIHMANNPQYAETHAEWRAKILAFQQWVKGLLARTMASKAQSHLEDGVAASSEQPGQQAAAAAVKPAEEEEEGEEAEEEAEKSGD